MARNEITIDFEPCQPAPANGYKVMYRPLGSSEPLRDGGNVFVSPAVIVTTLDLFGTSYEGTIQGDCGDDMLGLPVHWEAVNNSEESGSAPVDESTSGSVGGCDPLPVSWDFTRIGAVGVMTIKVNGTTVVNPSSNSSGSFFVNEGDTIQVLVSGTGTSFRSIVISGVVGGILFSDSQQSNLNHTFVAECSSEGYEISGTVEAA